MNEYINDSGKKLVLFDFDGTLTRSDTLVDFMRYHFGARFYFRLISLFPVLGFHFIGLVPAGRAKEALLTKFLKGMSLEEFNMKCVEYTSIRLPGILRKEALATLEEFRKEDADIYVVSASPENWIKPWCEKMQIGCIASKLEIIDGHLTGKLKGINCNGFEKVNRIRSEIDLSEYPEIFAFGDSKGDIPMLGLAGEHGYYQSFA